MRRNAVLQMNNDKENFASVVNWNQTMSTKDLIEIVERSKKTSQASSEVKKMDQIEEDLKNLRKLMASAKVSSTVPASKPANVKKTSKPPQPTSTKPPSTKTTKATKSTANVAVPSAQPTKHQPQASKEFSSSSTSSVSSIPSAKSSTNNPSAKPQHHNPNPPNAYNYIEIYRAKTTRAEQKRRDQEREARIFRPRPLPDFKRSHRLLEIKLTDLHKNPVCPETPPTLKRSIEAAARRQIVVSSKIQFFFFLLF